MWKTTLFCNTVLLGLFWMLSYIIITPAYNHMFQYSDSMPMLTSFALQIQSLSGIIPFSWLFISLIFGKWLRSQSENRRNEWIATHTSLTLCFGVMLLLFFSLSAILPILKFSAIEL